MSTSTDLMMEQVCLVDDDNNFVGHCLKSEVHGYRTPLHRAFSVFLFDDRNRLLLQQRALGKTTWPGIWSNSCCGHPAPGEATVDAAERRLREELNLGGGVLYEAIPDFRYRSRYLGIEENEVCPVFVGRINGTGPVNPEEVEAIDWIAWQAFLMLASAAPTDRWGTLSPWSRWEAHQLEQHEPTWRNHLLELPTFTPFN